MGCDRVRTRTLQSLYAAGEAGITPLEISTWALRLSHYILKLRAHGLQIEMEREDHKGPVSGWHGRYRLRTAIEFVPSLEAEDEDAEAIVLGWQPRTAVYLSDIGTIVIRQEADGYMDECDDLYLTSIGALQIAIEVADEASIPKPDLKLMAKPLDLGPSKPPAPMHEAIREAAE